MRRWFGAILFVASASCYGEPGNVISWFSNAQNELIFTCQFAVVKLDLPDNGVAHVRLTTNTVSFSTNASFTIIRNWPHPPMSVTDGATLVVSNAGLRVEATKTPFRLTFKKPDGTQLLTETNSFGLDYRGASMMMAFADRSGLRRMKFGSWVNPYRAIGSAVLSFMFCSIFSRWPAMCSMNVL